MAAYFYRKQSERLHIIVEIRHTKNPSVELVSLKISQDIRQEP